MKKLLSILLCSFICLQLTAQKTKKAVLVIVDGIPADVIESLPTPCLDEIASIGGYTRATMGGDKNSYNQTPTISAVGYNSVITGTWVNKHNVSNNSIKEPNYNYPTIFKLLKDQYPSKKTAIFSTWQDNRTKLIGENLPATNQFQLDYHFDGLELDTIQYPHDNNSNYIHQIDEAVIQNAEKYLIDSAPDLSWIYLQYTDDMGHRYGDSETFYNAVKLVDTQISKIWRAIQYREKHFEEDWEIYITTDHGRDSATGKGHGGQSERERSIWIVTNSKNTNPYFKEYTPTSVDIFPSIANHLNIELPPAVLFELDGIALNKKVSIISPSIKTKEQEIELSWKALEDTGMVRIWVSTTNHYKEGQKDDYKLKESIPIKNEFYKIPLDYSKSNFFKIVIESSNNTINRWLISNNQPTLNQ